MVHSAHYAEEETSETEASPLTLPEEGSIFTDRYLVESTESTCMQSGYMGKDLSSRQPVCLRFYSSRSSRLENVVRMHDILNDSSHISKLIERIPGKEGTSDCLVLEAGSCTLAQILGGERALTLIERWAIVHSILEALRHLHGRNVVHGNLDPSSIVWSTTDFCWKFLDLEFSVGVGNPIPIHERIANRYMAPEIQQALRQNTHSRQADVSMDMWSFGLIAFEIFTGTCILDSALVRNYVSKECSRLRQELRKEVADGRVTRQLSDFSLINDLLHYKTGSSTHKDFKKEQKAPVSNLEASKNGKDVWECFTVNENGAVVKSLPVWLNSNDGSMAKPSGNDIGTAANRPGLGILWAVLPQSTRDKLRTIARLPVTAVKRICGTVSRIRFRLVSVSKKQ